MTTSPIDFTVDVILCDSAATADGKLFLQGGGWNSISAPTFPFVQSRIGLGIIVGIPYTATNENHSFELRLLHEDGEPLSLAPAGAPEALKEQMTQLTGKFNMGRPPTLQPGDAQPMPLAMNFDQVLFPAPGKYTFELSIDGSERGNYAFRVLSHFATTLRPTGPGGA
ncbi:DUF6941 family protein [Actinomadura scrupuli]|uniref:DUF6941 family protein n=1 Tax=Actinomadura scrupuli TaxID=559629 RepID=UPI003D978732